jgi:hypothetical protein
VKRGLSARLCHAFVTPFLLLWVVGHIGMYAPGDVVVEFLQVLGWNEWFDIVEGVGFASSFRRLASLCASLLGFLLCLRVLGALPREVLRYLGLELLQLGVS